MEQTALFFLWREKDLCVIKIGKVQANTSRRQKYALCTLYEKGDWTVHANYEKVKILPKEKMDGNTCVLDVRTVNVKGQKRKLILTDRGDGPIVYKFKKSKLEESVKVGLI